jgi:hypothetical protein
VRGKGADVTEVGQDPGVDRRPDSGQVHQAARARTRALSSAVGLLHLRRDRDRDQLGQLLGGDPAAGLAGMSRGRTEPSMALA